jgi:Ice-binding-like/IPTL-CTERM motif
MKATGSYRSLLVGAGVAALLCGPSPTFAATAPSLGQATGFGVLAASAVTNTGASVIAGDLGISPGNASSVTGFPPGQVLGTPHFADALALGAQNDVTTAYNALASQACDTTISADLAGSTLPPGVYCSGSTMGLTGTLLLDAQGDPNAVFIFQIGSSLTTASGALVSVINGGDNCNVFWQIGASATLGTTTTFVGNILALSTITVNTGASVDGRALARTGAVTLDGNAISACGGAAGTTPTLGKAFSPANIPTGGGVSTLTITLRNRDVAVATLTAPLVDTLPSGVVIAATPNVSTTCGGVGAPVAVAGASTVTLPAGRTIPANGSCTLTVNVTTTVDGPHVNVLSAGALVTTSGTSAAAAGAILTVGAAAIPTLSEWVMIMLAALLVLFGVARIRRYAM